MDEYLSSEGRRLKNECEKFMDRVNPTLYNFTERAEFPYHLIAEIKALGITGMDVPKNFGGQRLSTFDAVACMYELARKDASVATFWLLHHSLGLYTVQKLAQEELRTRILTQCIPLNKVLAWGLTEPEHGSNASGIQSSAKKVEGGYLLNGRKRWIGNATFSDYICVWARNEAEQEKIQCFLL